VLDLERPEWLLRTQNNDNGLLDLGNPAARQWLTDHYCQLIRENGIKIYRQDHNFPPLDHWRTNDAEDRQGMRENLHVQGYLQFWDDLLARNPGLWLDSCASGGRRNDLETMRRSVPLHYTDYGYGDHPVKLAFHRTMYEWIPYFKECTLSWDISEEETRADAGWDGGAGGSTTAITVRARFDPRIDSYAYHCGMAPMLFATLDIRRDDYDFALATKMIDVWRRAAPLMLYGDYYPHTPFHRSASEWVVRQFDDPVAGHGLVQGIRLPAAPAETTTVHLQGIDSDTQYRFENVESGETREIAGAALIRNGFTFALPARGGAIWFYRKC
jgi:alpha-galactosidase